MRSTRPRLSSLWSIPVLALALTSLSPVGASAEPRAKDSKKETGAAGLGKGDLDDRPGRPDSVSASVSARLSGVAVEDLSQRTQDTRFFALPDGTWKSETTSGPAQVQDGDRGEDGTGGWNRIDATLEKSGKGLSPKHSAVEVKFSGGDTEWFAKVTRDGHTLDYSFDGALAGKLPTPKVDGDTVVYRDVFDGVVEDVDLVMKASGTGFSHWLVLTKAPSADELEALGAAAGDDVSFPVRVEDSNAKSPALVEVGKAGNIAITDAAGKELITASAPLAWDAQTMGPEDFDPAAVALATRGDSSLAKSRKPEGAKGAKGAEQAKAKVVAIDTDVEQSKDKAKRAKQGSQVALGVEKSFLTDATTAYPVTVDPSMTIYTGDTWVQTPTYPNSQSSSAELKVGTYNGGTDKARSFMNFGTTAWNGKYINSAKLVMRNFYSGSCVSGDIRVNRITEAWDASTLTWANQPAATTTNRVDVGTAKGYNSSCAEGNVTWDVTEIVRDWVHDGAARHGLRMKAVDETSNNTWRRYRSGNYSANSDHRPHIDVTYNSYPYTAGTPSVDGMNGSGYVKNSKPTIKVAVSDPEGGSVKANVEVLQGSTVKWSGTTANVASGGTASITTGALADGTYTIRAKGNDGSLQSKSWGPSRTMIIDTAAPSVSISASAYTAGQWRDTTPSSNTFTFTSTSADIASFKIWTNGGNSIVLNANSNRQATYAWNPGVGGHRVAYLAIDKAGNESATTWFIFGNGSPSMTVPAAGTVPRVSGNVQVQASGPWSSSGTNSAKVQWRLAGETGAWTDAPGSATVTQNGATALANYTLDVRGIATSTVDARLPLLVDLQVCFVYTTPSTTKCTTGTRQIKRIPHAFSEGFPTTTVEGGEVALWTGEFMSSATDATLDAGSTSLSISRTHSSFGGAHSSAAGNVFGPGWVTELSGSESGIEGLELLDSTRHDGTLKLLDSDGTVLIFAPKNAVASGTLSRRTAANLTTGEWWPIDEETAETGLSAVVAGSGTSTTVKFTDGDGVVTTYTALTAPTSTANAVFMPTSVEEPGNPGQTTFAYTGGKVSKIGAPAPTGVTCPALSSTGTLPDGCRVLEITYATSTTATSSTPGDQNGQVKSITARNGSSSKVLATYKYDSSKRLVEVTDAPAGLTTKYTYSGGTSSGWYQLASLTPPGLTPVEYVYSSDAEKRLVQVNRDRVDGDIAKSSDPKARLNTIVYDLPAKGQDATNRGLPSLDATRTEAWHSHVEEMPEAANAVAVFGADRKPAATPTGADFKYADLHYTDAKGYDVYGAEYAAGDWRYTATQYDTSNSNVVRSLSVEDTEAIATGAATAPMVGTLTVYNEVLHNKVNGVVTPLADGDPNGVIMPAGSVVTDVYAPARVANAEGSAWMRVHTRTVYDEGAPNSKINPTNKQRYAAATSVYTSLADSDATGVRVGSVGNPDAGAPAGESLTSLTRNGYAAPATVTNITAADHVGAVADVANEAKRWELALPASTTTVMGSSPDASKDITSRTAYDSKGRVIATVQPNAVAANPGVYIPAHAGTRLTQYYKGGSVNQEKCVDNTQADFLCRTTYAGKAAGNQDLITSHVWMRSFQGQPIATVDTGAGDAWRLNWTDYDAAGRVTTQSVSTTGVPNSQALPYTTREYSSTTGLETKVTPSTGSPIEKTYDGWGRERTYTTSSNGGAGGAADRTTTTYDAAGRVNTVADSSTANGGSVLTYTYNSTTAGAEDYRGLPTKIAATNPNGRAVEITGTYDALGNLVTQTMPGGVVQNSTYDTAGELTEVSYDVGAWKSLMAWSQRHDALGRVIAENTPGTMGVEGEYMREYDYDQAARLTQVVDRLSYWGTTECATRGYTFDRNGNRTEKTSASCVDGSSSTTQAWSYDDADRLTGTTGAPYQYDGLGRVVSVPGVDTPKAGHSGVGLTLAYYDDDSAHTIQQGNGDTTTIALDAAGRRSINTTSGSTSKTETRHYTDGSDNPGWSSTTQAGVTTTERYIPGLNGDLAVVINGGGTGNGIVQVALTTPHGDVAVQVTLPSSGDANWIDGWHPTDEYGNQLNAFSVLAGDTATNNQSSVPGGIGYGWLGAKERAMDNSGVVLMGARLYNPMTGAFTSVDPVFGGNTTAYAYPQDPINMVDLDGLKRRFWPKKSFWKKTITVVAVGTCVVASAGTCAVAGLGAAGLNYGMDRKKKNAKKDLAKDVAITLVSGGGWTSNWEAAQALAETSWSEARHKWRQYSNLFRGGKVRQGKEQEELQVRVMVSNEFPEITWRTIPMARAAGFLMPLGFGAMILPAEVDRWFNIALVAVSALIGWVLAFRPKIILDDECVTVVNPLRTLRVPLEQVKGVEPGYSGIEISTFKGLKIEAWAVQEMNLTRWLGRTSRAASACQRITEYVQGARQRGESLAEGSGGCV